MKIHWAWIVLASSFITLFINYSIRIGAYSVLLPGMVRDLHLNMTQAGMIRAAYFFAYILFSPLTGWLMDHIGGRWVISFFCLFLGSGTFLMGRADSLAEAAFFHALVGMGAAAIWTPVSALIQKWFGTEKRGLAMGILSPSYAMGFGLMGILLPTVVDAYSWRMGWVILGIAALFLPVMNYFFLKNDPKEMGLLPWGEEAISIQAAPAYPLFQYKDLLRESHFWLIGVSYLFISIGAYILSDFIVTYGAMELALPYPTASALITLMALAGIAGGLILMPLSDFIGRKRSLMVINFMVALSILLIILVRENLLLLRVGMGWFGFFYGAIWPMYAVCARDYFPKEISGTIIGLFTLFYGVGAMAGPLLAGHLVDVTGTFRWPFGVGAAASLAAAILIGFLKRPEKFQRRTH
jgi:sugar phosphate permease